MQKIDRQSYEKSLQKLQEIFQGIASHTQEQARFRCPYKNRHDHCTAKFGCRYQRADGEIVHCTSDDKLDYRTAWEIDPDGYQSMRRQLQSGGQEAARASSDP